MDAVAEAIDSANAATDAANAAAEAADAATAATHDQIDLAMQKATNFGIYTSVNVNPTVALLDLEINALKSKIEISVSRYNEAQRLASDLTLDLQSRRSYQTAANSWKSAERAYSSKLRDQEMMRLRFLNADSQIAKAAADKAAADKAAADKAAADKAAADKAAADKAATDKAAADKAAADKAAALKSQLEAKSAADKLIADAKITAARILAAAKAKAAVVATKKTTITCVKGKLTKKVTAVKPKCPSGYKVKK